MSEESNTTRQQGKRTETATVGVAVGSQRTRPCVVSNNSESSKAIGKRESVVDILEEDGRSSSDLSDDLVMRRRWECNPERGA